MCIGWPMQIVEAHPGSALAEREGARQTIGTLLLDGIEPGAWVLVFQGQAVRTLMPDEALAIDRALAALAAASTGEVDVGAYFADLVDRTPQLPPHLRKEPT